MTNITKPTATELKKWRTQATRAAAHLKTGAAKPKAGEDFIRAGFGFDDDSFEDGSPGMRVISLDIALADIARMTGQELTDHIYNGVLQKAQEHTPPAGHA